MKKTTSNLVLALATTAIVAGLAQAQPVQAAPVTSAETTPAASSVASQTINEIQTTRSTMYDDPSIPFEGQTLQTYVTNQGLTKDQYVNGISYDTAVEQTAQRRAQETAAHGQINHTADGVNPATYNDSSAWGENLAFGTSLSVGSSFDMWVDKEVAPLKAANGHFNFDNGHLYQILNPANKSFGYGQVSGGPYGQVSALALSQKQGPGQVGQNQPTTPANTGNQGTAPTTPANTGNQGTTPTTPANTGNQGTTPTTPANTGNQGTTPTTPANTGNQSTAPTTPSNTGNQGTAPTTPANTDKPGVAPTPATNTNQKASTNKQQAKPASQGQAQAAANKQAAPANKAAASGQPATGQAPVSSKADTGKLPATGAVSLASLGLALAGLGTGLVFRKNR
ncbi:hypothetical protein AWM75_03185 [Aerococcus urinaehominis]|uniref:Uncharacterized protein n=1 Tax=Aerococcus urinaehominis TaxID=128944 RepID=A0A0X8FL42_9LACT|nr:hypothetical protein [Aerococcus urinaehominis]AMB99064.1 hypothetical protein AWM75_03185 [Aerococcus urinaehominis]SDM59607.1 hypothetical protein SAMN04487985_12710 [Aerococcus urinaehominis]